MGILNRFFFSTLATVFFVGGLLFSPTVNGPFSPLQSIEFSSKLPPQNSCIHFYTNNKKYFNTVLFQVYKTSLSKQEQISDQDIRESIKSPEHFLAVIEILSSRENYEGFRFEDRIQQLSPRELKKLKSVLNSYTKNETLSHITFSNLLVALYRVFHKPPDKWRTLYQTRSLKETWEKMDDALIRERLETSLFSENMETTFQTVISDPTLRQKFVQNLKKNAPWIDTALFLALWGSAIGSRLAVGFEVNLSPSTFIDIMPPYIPGMGQILKISLEPSDLRTARIHGLKKATDDAKTKLKSMFSKIHRTDVLRWTYSSIFTGMFLITVGPDLYKLTTPEGRFNLMMQDYGDSARRSNEMTAEERGDAFYQDYVDILKAQGTLNNFTEAELKAKRQEYIDIARGAEEAFRQTKNPN